VGVAERPRSEAEVADFLREFREFLVKEWARYVWAELLATAELRSLVALGEAASLGSFSKNLARSLKGERREYWYTSPRGYAAMLGVEANSPRLLIELSVYHVERGFIMEKRLSNVYGLAEAVVDLYREGLGAEPLEGLAGLRPSEGLPPEIPLMSAAEVPELARFLEAVAGLYRASEPYIASELVSDPGEPPEEFRQDLVSEVLPVVERAAYQLASGRYRSWLQVAERERYVQLAEGFQVDVLGLVLQFEKREDMAPYVASAVERYRLARAKKAVLRVALAMGLLE